MGGRPGHRDRRHRTAIEQHRGGGHRRVPYLPVDRIETQVAVVGAGGAGLYTALCAAREGARVTLVSATPLIVSPFKRPVVANALEAKEAV